MGAGLFAFFASILWVCATGFAAYLNGEFWPSQMLAKFPNHPVHLPFSAHGGMWGDIFIISPLLGVVVATHGKEWRSDQIATTLVIGMVLSGIMHWQYRQTPFPDSLAWRGASFFGFSVAGMMHFIYMGAAFALIGLLYFSTPEGSRSFIIAASIALGAHGGCGNHMPLGTFSYTGLFAWCPDFLNKLTFSTIFGAFAILAAMAGWTTGSPRVGVVVFLSCIAAGIIILVISTIVRDTILRRFV